MLTRGAAGPPDVPIPSRLVTSGPLLLSLQNTQTHTHKEMLLQMIHRTRATTQKGSYYAIATTVVHKYTTIRKFFKGN